MAIERRTRRKTTDQAGRRNSTRRSASLKGLFFSQAGEGSSNVLRAVTATANASWRRRNSTMIKRNEDTSVGDGGCGVVHGIPGTLDHERHFRVEESATSPRTVFDLLLLDERRTEDAHHLRPSGKLSLIFVLKSKL